MKKIKCILIIILIISTYLFIGCSIKEELKVTSKITSISATNNSITFYETTNSNLEIKAKATIECNGILVNEIENIVINSTTEYTFNDLLPETEYNINILYTYNSSSYIKITSEIINTLKPEIENIEIICESKEYIYDGQAKSLTAQTNNNLELKYEYYLNNELVNEVINVGEYKVIISFKGNELYNPNSIERTLIIKPKEIKIELDDLDIYYGDDYEINPNLDMNYDIKYYQNDTLLASKPLNVGKYKVLISITDSNYIGNKEFEFEIKQKEIDISLNSFNIDYGNDYEINPNLDVDYEIKYYQNDILLASKPTKPGNYTVTINIIDSNYKGSKTINVIINKLDYKLDYHDIFILYGNNISFEVDDFVNIKYYLNNNMVEKIEELGTYKVVFSIKDNDIYNDLNYEITVIVDNKYIIDMSINNLFFEENIDYQLEYNVNFDIDLSIKYYLNDLEINKPTTKGIYKVLFYYEEDDTYNSFNKTYDLYIYPAITEIKSISEGLYHVTGTVIEKNNNYSIISNDSDVIFINDITLELNNTYDLIGIYEENNLKIGSVLKKNKIDYINEKAINVSLIEFDEDIDYYLYKYISLNGMVIYNDDYYLALEDDYNLKLNQSYNKYYLNKNSIKVEFVFYNDTYIYFNDEIIEFSDLEKVYAEALLFKFDDIAEELPLDGKLFDVKLEYVSTSNSNIISIHPLKINRTNKDEIVTLGVEFSIGINKLIKEFKVKVLKEEITELTIYSIEMHQQYGDSILITYGDFDILIDAGDKKDGAYVNEFLKEHISSDNHLDMMIVTHCHSDHMGGLAYTDDKDKTVKALDGIASIGTIIDYGHDRKTNYLHNSWVKIRNSYIDKGSLYYPVYDCAKNTNGAKSHHQIDNNLSFDFVDTLTYAKPSDDISKENNVYSIATLLTYKNFKFFFAGDLEDKGEKNLYNNYQNTVLKNITNDNVVLYKAAHHGTDPGKGDQATMSSNGGNQLPFLKLLKPDYFFASAAMCNGSGDMKFIGGQAHPYPRALANFKYFTDDIYFNGTNGTLEFITNGYELTSIHGYGATTNYLVDGAMINYDSEKDLKLIDTLWYKKYRKSEVDSAYEAIKKL